MTLRCNDLRHVALDLRSDLAALVVAVKQKQNAASHHRLSEHQVAFRAFLDRKPAPSNG